MQANLVILPGDGVGPEVSAAAVAVLKAVAERGGHVFDFDEHPIGGAAIDATGEPLPEATRKACQKADAVLLGAVGGPKWSNPDARVRPEQGLLGLRAALGVYANLRPLRVHPRLAERSPLKTDRLTGVDFVVIRELTGGAYFGAKTRTADSATDECKYTVAEIERVLRRSFELARQRGGRLTSVDKANVLETSRLWRSTAMLPSASLDQHNKGMYEPIHGSAPDIAGQGVANPMGTIASAALLLRHALGLEDEAQQVEAAIDHVIEHGPLTRDIGGHAGTEEVRDAVISALDLVQTDKKAFFTGMRACG
jgi:3-isopropylmalate dehydrogenase